MSIVAGMPVTPDVEVVGRILRENRYQRALTQDQLAELTGMPQTRISRFELGLVTDPSIRDLLRLAEILDIDLDDLIAPFRPRPSGRRRPQLSEVA
jgi:transcriptional regulator with XRE-family HTH domain